MVTNSWLCFQPQNVTTDDQPQTVTKEEQTAEAQRVAMETKVHTRHDITNLPIPPVLVISFVHLFKEWEKQALVDATHLEIPAELAMVYSHLQGKGKGIITIWSPCGLFLDLTLTAKHSSSSSSQSLSHFFRTQTPRYVSFVPVDLL